MDVFIKAFNRPYYLERCVRSIERHVHGSLNITVLDDGTPLRYLAKIKQLFPHVTIDQSEYSKSKVNSIEDHLARKKKFSDKRIPFKFWREQIAKGSDFFLLMEDDSWFVDDVDIDELESDARKFDLSNIKLSWSGNENIIRGKKISKGTLDEIIPQLPTENEPLLAILLNNRWKVASLGRKLGLLPASFFLPYYSLYTVTSAVFKRDFWLKVTEDHDDTVNENIQLLKAYQIQRTGRLHVGKTRKELIQTTFSNSAINPFVEPQFDFISFHHQMNEAWCTGKLNATVGFPGDFPVQYLSSFLSEDKYPESRINRWLQWIEFNKNQFRQLGSQVN